MSRGSFFNIDVRTSSTAYTPRDPDPEPRQEDYDNSWDGALVQLERMDDNWLKLNIYKDGKTTSVDLTSNCDIEVSESEL